FCPAADAERHTFWLFPAVVRDPARAIDALTRAGFDASQGQSLVALPAPPDRPELEPVRAQETLAHMILLPCYAGMPAAELRRMAGVLIRAESAAAACVHFKHLAAKGAVRTERRMFSPPD